jgi:hypothetical protein
MFSLFKKKKFDISKYEDGAFVKKQWIEHFFVVPFVKPKDKSHLEYLAYLENLNQEFLSYVAVHSIGIAEVGKSVSIKSYRGTDIPREYARVLQFVNSTKDSYFMLIRFPNAKTEDLEKGAFFGFVDSSEKRSYKFSPIQSIKVPEICKSVESVLYTLTKIKPHQSMTLVTGVNNEVIVHDFDGLQYFSYSLNERAKLYAKYPELDVKIFPMDFVSFAEWIISKEDDSPAMKRNAERTRELLKY